MLPSKKLNYIIVQSLKEADKRLDQMYRQYISFLALYNKQLLVKYYQHNMSVKEDPVILFEQAIVNYPNVMRTYMQMLRKNNYRMKDKILECICEIATSDNPNKKMAEYQKFPWIKKILFDDKTKMFTVCSIEGEYSFIPVSFIYQKDVLELKMLHKKMERKSEKKIYSNGYDLHEPGNLDYACHFVTEQFAYRNPFCLAVTAICPHIFPNSYWYHSYNMAEDQSYVIDIANGFIMQTDHFYKLLEPIVLDQVKGKDIPSHVQVVLEDTYYPYRDVVSNSVLKGLAFYKYDCQSSYKREEIHSKLIR